MSIYKIFFLAFVIVLSASQVHSREPYSAKITVDSTTAKEDATNILGLTDDLKSSSIKKLIPIYTPTSATSIRLNLRGIKANASFPANSTTLVFSVPQLGITKKFSGATRDQSVILFKDYLKDTVHQKHHGFLKAHARLTPIDPIAGNPNSLLAQMAQADFLMGRLTPFNGCSDCWEAQPVTHLFNSEFDFTRVFSNRFDTAAYNTLLRYSYSPERTWALILDVPLSVIYTGGAYSAASSVGVGFRLPITHSWSLTPTLRYGAGGSVDLDTAGDFVATGLTSVYNLRLFNFVLSLMDSIGYYTTTNLWLGGINFNYRLHNTIFKNGLFLTSCKGVCFCGREVHFSTWWIDSYFAEDKLFIKHYDEIGFSFITTHILPCLCYDSLSLGAAYQFGNHGFHGYTINLAYQF